VVGHRAERYEHRPGDARLFVLGRFAHVDQAGTGGEPLGELVDGDLSNCHDRRG
jgi:hypothetical protein